MLAAPVLIVEDDPEVCQVIEETLSNEGYSVAIAQSGSKALGSAQQTKFSAAIIGPHVSDIKAKSLLQRIKKQQPQISGILLTSNRTVESLKQGIDDGFADVLGTPLNPHRLLSSVEMVVNE